MSNEINVAKYYNPFFQSETQVQIKFGDVLRRVEQMRRHGTHRNSACFKISEIRATLAQCLDLDVKLIMQEWLLLSGLGKKHLVMSVSVSLVCSSDLPHNVKHREKVNVIVGSLLSWLAKCESLT